MQNHSYVENVGFLWVQFWIARGDSAVFMFWLGLVT